MVARSEFPVTVEEMDEIADGVTRSILKHYDASKVRKPPITSRADRAIAADLVVQQYRELIAAGKKPSVRALAAKTGLSKSAIGRIIKDAGVSLSSSPEPLSGVHARAHAILTHIVPPRSRRMVEVDRLRSALSGSMEPDELEDIGAIIQQIELTTRDIQLKLIDEQTLFVSRDRPYPPDEIAEWVADARLAQSKQRNPYKRSLMKFAIPSRRSGLTGVARDLLAIIDIIEDPRSIENWSDFIDAVVSVGAHDETCTPSNVSFGDKRQLLKILDSGRGFEGDLADRLQRVSSWFEGTQQWSVVQILVDLREEIERSMYSKMEADQVQGWAGSATPSGNAQFVATDAIEEHIIKEFIAISGYREKIKDGRLHARNYDDIDKLLSTYEMAFLDSRPPRLVVEEEMSVGYKQQSTAAHMIAPPHLAVGLYESEDEVEIYFNDEYFDDEDNE